MRRPSETKLRALLLALVLVPGALLVLKIVTGVGPDLPGPRLREALGVVEPFGPCTPTPEGVVEPAQPVSAAAVPWRRHADVPAFGDEELRAVAVGGIIYGGTAVRASSDGRDFSALAPFYAYDPRTESVRTVRPLPAPAHHTAMAVYGGDVYVFGGFTSEGTATNRVWRYSPATNRWRELAPMPRPRGGLAGAVIGDRFYAVGGASSAVMNYPKVYRVLDVYDFARDRWTKGPRMSVGRHHVAAAAVGGQMYVVGGRSNRSLALDDVERFDPRTGTWERVAPLPLGSGGLEAVAWEGKLLVLGGGDDKIGGWVTPATWSFDPATERWTRLGDMIVPRHGFAAAIADGRLYALGGAPCARYGQTPAVESMPLS